MSVLTAETGIRVHSTATVHRQHVIAAQPVRVVTWSTTRDGVWNALVGSASAGTIERIDAGFQVRDWQGSVESIHTTLDAAQLSLEPAVRESARATAAAICRRAGLLSSSTTVMAVIGFAGVVVTWVATNPF